MRAIILPLVFCAVLLAPLSAHALGELRIGGDMLIKPGAELDPVTGDSVLSGPRVDLHFQPFDLFRGGPTLGLGLESAAVSDDLFQYYTMDMKLLTLDFSLGYRLFALPWLSVWARAEAGPERIQMTLRDRSAYGDVHDSTWSWHAGAVGSVTFYLPPAWVDSWKPWESFNFGISLEGGYRYRPDHRFSLSQSKPAPSGEAVMTPVDMGDLSLAGPFVRVLITWAF